MTASFEDGLWEATFQTIFKSFEETCSGTTDDRDRHSGTGNAKKYSSLLLEASMASSLQSAKQQLDRIRQAHGYQLRSSSTRLNALLEQVKCIQQSSSLAHSTCSRHAFETLQRLSNQATVTETRISDLVFEVKGEYEKNSIRVVRRQDFLDNAKNVQLIWLAWKHQWHRCAHRLIYDYRLEVFATRRQPHQLSSRVLCSHKDAEEFLAAQLRLRKRLSGRANANLRVVSIVRIYKTRSGQPLSAAAEAIAAAPLVASNLNELAAFPRHIDQLLAKLFKPPPPISSSSSSLLSVGSAGRPLSRGHSSARLSIRDRDGGSAVTGLSSGVSMTSLENFGVLLSAAVIEWMYPMAYQPLLCDHMSSSLTAGNSYRRRLAACKQELPTFTSISDLKPIQQVIESFYSRYALQHSSSLLFSDRLYFCLEERYLSLSSSSGNTPITSSGEQNKVVLFLLLMDLLQKIYCEKVNGRFTLSLPELRLQLALPLLCLGNVSSHRNFFEGNFVNDLTQYPIAVYDDLKAFPDILKVQCVDGVCLHFAPASVAHLPESSTFRFSNPNVDELRHASRQCPHPSLSALAQPSHDILLSRIYCTINANSIFHSQAVAATAMYMCPLADACVQELYRHYLWPPLPVPTGLAVEMDGTMVPRHLQVPCKFGLIVPDHARYRVQTGDHIMQLNQREDDQLTSTGTAFNYKYALFADEYNVNSNNHDSLSSGVDTSDGQSAAITQSCIYLAHLLDYDAYRQSCNDAATATAPDLQQAVAGSNSEDHSAVDLETGRSNMRDHQNEDLLLRCILLNKEGISSNSAPSSSASAGVGGLRSPTHQSGKTSSVSLKKAIEAGSDLGDSISTGTSSSKATWDNSVISTLCRWRVCTSESCSSKRHLCRYHEHLKAFMDSTQGRALGYDTAQYIPRRAPTIPAHVPLSKRDLILIRAASSLLQELWDGKLKSTVRSFTSKSQGDMNLRARLQATLPLYRIFIAAMVEPKRLSDSHMLHESKIKYQLTTPNWVALKDPDLIRGVEGLQMDTFQLIEGMLSLEKDTSRQLIQLLELRVFPSAEIASCRKDFKTLKEFDDQQQGTKSSVVAERSIFDSNYYQGQLPLLNMELKLCDKKFSAFARRVTDEIETKRLHAKKMARIKAIEETQPKGAGFKY